MSLTLSLSFSISLSLSLSLSFTVSLPLSLSLSVSLPSLRLSSSLSLSFSLPFSLSLSLPLSPWPSLSVLACASRFHLQDRREKKAAPRPAPRHERTHKDHSKKQRLCNPARTLLKKKAKKDQKHTQKRPRKGPTSEKHRKNNNKRNPFFKKPHLWKVKAKMKEKNTHFKNGQKIKMKEILS